MGNLTGFFLFFIYLFTDFTGIFIFEKYTSSDHVVWECAFKDHQVKLKNKN